MCRISSACHRMTPLSDTADERDQNPSTAGTYQVFSRRIPRSRPHRLCVIRQKLHPRRILQMHNLHQQITISSPSALSFPILPSTHSLHTATLSPCLSTQTQRIATPADLVKYPSKSFSGYEKYLAMLSLEAVINFVEEHDSEVIASV
jgi:hypothetical protein